MSKISTSSADVVATKYLGFSGLQIAFGKTLEEAFAQQNAQILRNVYDSYTTNTDHDKKSPMDHAFREFLLFKLSHDVESIGSLIKLSVQAVRHEIVSVTIPVVLLSDIFETVTLDKCELIFGYVEEMVNTWKEDIFFSSCKNNILRMCNDLLRRLSRAQNTVFCGRILLFLSKFFPISERSGLNIVSEFNIDNITEYGKEGGDELLEECAQLNIKLDYGLYCKFWSLQEIFRNPNQFYNKTQARVFQLHASVVLEAFSTYKLEDPQIGTSSAKKPKTSIKNEPMEIDEELENQAYKKKVVEYVNNSKNYFAKFLTNPKLLALQLSDSNFRRAVLLEFLFLFQYLKLPVKFKTDSNVLSTAQSEYIQDTEKQVYVLLEETPPNGKRFARSVRHMILREEMWNNWKNEGCKEYKKPGENAETSDDEEPSQLAKRPKPTLGRLLCDAQHEGKFFLGNDVLTRLWNYSPDNLHSCKSEERNFLPQVDSYLESPREKNDPSSEWRALRLLARQSPHFFTSLNTPSYKISDYLESVRKKIARDKLESLKAQLVASTSGINVSGNSTSSLSIVAENGNSADPNEQEGVAIRDDQENLQENDIEVDEETSPDLEKSCVEDDQNTHSKPVTATREHLEELSPLIGDDWKRLGKKLGYAADEVLFFEQQNPEREAGCVAMLVNWFADDDDANLDNLAYILEGLKINTAAKAVKALIERLEVNEGTSVDKVEILSE